MLLSCRDDFLVLHDFLVEVNLWDSCDLFVTLQLVLPLLDICIGSWMLRDCLGCSFPLTCASPRTSPCLGRSPLVCFACRWLCSSLACCCLCSSACCWLCPSRFFSSFLPSRRLSAALRRRFDVLLALLVPVLLYFVLLFTTDSLAVGLSLLLSRDTLW